MVSVFGSTDLFVPERGLSADARRTTLKIVPENRAIGNHCFFYDHGLGMWYAVMVVVDEIGGCIE